MSTQRLLSCYEKLDWLIHSLQVECLKCLSCFSAAMTLKLRIMGTNGVWVQCWGIWSRRGRTPHVSQSRVVTFISEDLFIFPNVCGKITPTETVPLTCQNKHCPIENKGCVCNSISTLSLAVHKLVFVSVQNHHCTLTRKDNCSFRPWLQK